MHPWALSIFEFSQPASAWLAAQLAVNETPCWRILVTLQWRHNEPYDVSNHQPHDCLLNHLFRRRSKKTPKLRVTALCEGNSPVTGEFPAQRASNTENVSIWWRHRVIDLDCNTGFLVIQATLLNYHQLSAHSENGILFCVMNDTVGCHPRYIHSSECDYLYAWNVMRWWKNMMDIGVLPWGYFSLSKHFDALIKHGASLANKDLLNRHWI